MLHELKGDPEAARGYYEEALEIDPDFEQAKEALDKLNGGELANSEAE